MIKQSCIASVSVSLNLNPSGIKSIQDACVFWEQWRVEGEAASLTWLIFLAP